MTSLPVGKVTVKERAGLKLAPGVYGGEIRFAFREKSLFWIFLKIYGLFFNLPLVMDMYFI